MFRKGTLRTLGAVLVAAAMGLLPVVASADNDGKLDSDKVLFQTSRAAANVCWVTTKCNPGAQTYTFTTVGGSCTGASVGTEDQELLTPCQITSSGTFVNVTCGTGLVSGSATAGQTTIKEDTSNSGDGTTYDAPGYVIPFVAGLGVVVAPGISESNDSDGANTEEGDGGGVVLISPDDNSGAATTIKVGPLTFQDAPGKKNWCTNGFRVQGVLWTDA